MKLLLLGATGAVGTAVLDKVLADPRFDAVTAPTRRTLPAHPKLTNPVLDFAALDGGDPLWRADAVISALGTTQKIAGSRAAFRAVDHDLVLATAGFARKAGAGALAVVSSVGASSRSPSFYLKTKGEMEEGLQSLGYPSLTIVRPSMIDVRRPPPRAGEAWGLLAFDLLRPVLPRRLRSVTPARIADALIGAVVAAPDGARVIESEAIP
ncbi:NAD(P)H-binding protein [Zavarzinia sp.]|uniref:NAD(P)H-binding protein n=1 Tax=Zavarzinia sp. TaxID=2027920 RepID=UPI00356AB251